MSLPPMVLTLADVVGVMGACAWPIEMRQVSIEFRDAFDTRKWGCPHASKTIKREHPQQRRRRLPWLGMKINMREELSINQQPPSFTNSDLHQRMLSDRGINSIHLSVLSPCRITDVSALASLRRVVISNVQLVSDVSALRNVHTLVLDGLPLVSDVSALGGVHTLTLIRLPLVSDVSALGSVHKLELFYLRRVSDVSALGGVHTLAFNELPLVSDVSALGNVHMLTLCNMMAVSDVSALGGVSLLGLIRLPLVSDVSALGGVRLMGLHSLPLVSDVSALYNVHTLTLHELPLVSDVSALCNVHALTLYNMPLVSDVSALVFSDVHLYINGCERCFDTDFSIGINNKRYEAPHVSSVLNWLRVSPHHIANRYFKTIVPVALGIVLGTAISTCVGAAYLVVRRCVR